MPARASSSKRYDALLAELGGGDEENTLIPVVVETPKDRRNKYAYSERLGGFTLKLVLPSGLSFPYDFGFVPLTHAEDGDPLDVLLLLDEPAFTGCFVAARLVGVLEGLQIEEGRKTRNDRLIAVAMESHTHKSLRRVRELDPHLRSEIEQFFIDFHEQRGKTFKPMGWRGPKRAMRLLERGRRAFSKRKPRGRIALPALCEVSA